MANAEPCLLPPFLVDYLEEKEAIQSLTDKYQELALDFASVKVEFCDLDGMGWKKHRDRSANREQNLLPTSSVSSLPTTTSSDDNSSSSLRHAKTAEGHNKNHPRRQKGLKVVTSRTKVEPKDCADDDFTLIQYSGGTPLFRSGSSSFVNTFEASDLAGTSLEEGNDDARVETPRPQPAREAGTSYFDK